MKPRSLLRLPARDGARRRVQHLCTVGGPTRRSLGSHLGGQTSRHGAPVLCPGHLSFLMMAPSARVVIHAGSAAGRREAVQGFLEVESCVCIGETKPETEHVQNSELSVVSGPRWGPRNMFPVGEGVGRTAVLLTR